MILVFWRPQEWLVQWLFGWPVLDVVVVLSLMTLLIEIDQGRQKMPRRAPQLYLLAGLWLSAIMSHVANTYFKGMMDTIFPVFKICFFTMLLICVLDRPGRLRVMMIIFVSMSCVMAVHAIMQEVRGYGFTYARPMYVPAWRERPAHTRSLFFGIFEDPNDLAQLLATAIPFAFVITRRRSLFGFLLACAITALLVRGIMSTHSRSGFLAALAAACIMFALLLPARLLPTVLVCLVVTALLLCPLSAGYLDVSAHDRVVYWGMANEVFKQNPIFGIGHDMFWQVADERAAHNAFVLCYTTLGIVGYWFWYCLLQVGIVGAWRARVSLTNIPYVDAAWLRRLCGMTIAAIAGFSVSAYFLSRTFVYPLFFLFAILAVLPIVAQRFLPEKHPVLLAPRKDVFVTGSIGTLASMVYIYFSIIFLNKAWYG